MTHVERTEVEITVTDNNTFVIKGEIEGGLESFFFKSQSTYFNYWFPSGEINSLDLPKNLKPEQEDIIEVCEKKI